ncbi:MAG: histidinol-phosphate transaminase [Micrococcales bacterium]|nr:histidinol-phosphate transaminase [Micrococcales bacterium]MEC7591657.1 histidinol-phosphate transaminase [Actinomycetota bacterium]MEC8405762.1 histidinol-phosphate transaminase [Actinomycetota bacterium]MEC8649076.1 histidinol-phosphate transaminase [Actinomycetota bacterium]MED5345287.1 histidinol-phosphate transaminase [Actinomycetota bacterium]
MTAPRLRPEIDSLPAYKAGQMPAPRTDIETYKISSNETPFEPPEAVRRAIERAAATVHRYPDPFSRRLTGALARRFDVAQEQIALGTGSVAVVGQLIWAAAGPGDSVVYPWRSFEAYPIWVQMTGARSVQVPLLADERHDLPLMLEAIDDSTRIVFVCNPNNPTGEAVRRDELTEFIDAVPSDVIVVLDEAYREFISDTDVPDGLDFFHGQNNVVVMRTFSKAYGLAGLRVGFAIAPEPIAEGMRKTALPFGVSSIAEDAALAALECEDELFERVRHLSQERDRVWQALADQGWDIHPSHANFVWLRLGERTQEFAQACDAAGITIRAFPDEGVRISVAEEEANDRVIDVGKSLV